MAKSYDVVVVGAGVFGAWIAHWLRRAGRSVALVDAYGAGNSRSSSGGESRVLRMGYGADEIYTRWAARSRELWTELFDRVNRPELFRETGALWTSAPRDRRTADTIAAFDKCGVRFEFLIDSELRLRYPHIQFSSERTAMYEPDAGVLLARRSVQAVVEDAIRNGVDYLADAVSPPEAGAVKTQSGETLQAADFVFACGPWLPKLFPAVLQGLIRPTRQEVFFFGVPAGNRCFAPPRMPVWLDFGDERRPYTLPDFESRGFKLAFDRYGPEFDPDTGDRLARGADEAKAFIAERFPALAGAPVLESRVCQYENSISGDFLIDRHPQFGGIWFAGGGSGHGFKHGPAVGEYMARVLQGSIQAEPRFTLEAHLAAGARRVH